MFIDLMEEIVLIITQKIFLRISMKKEHENL